jgi:hypothetical protein
MQYADGEGQCGLTLIPKPISGWDVENTWLMSSIRCSGCRQLERYPDFEH